MMSLIWEDLDFTTRKSILDRRDKIVSLKNRRILSKLNGVINRGELVALMGPSGAGKSTLLNCLTQGKKYKGFEGRIRVNGVEETVRASLINQDESEHLILPLTVSQSLGYASRLKNPSKTPYAVHAKIVEDLIQDLKLEGTEHTPVEQCSGGQKKRLAIALELCGIAKPQFLFLDEPTSGLDSFVGHRVMEVLKELGLKHNMAIVATIHQPSFKLFQLFDRVFILSGTGEFTYSSSPLELKALLFDCGYEEVVQGFNENPVDVAIEVASSLKRNLCLNYREQTGEPTQGNGIDDLLVPVQINPEEEGLLDLPNIKICKEMIKRLKVIPLNPVPDSNLSLSPGKQMEKQGLCQNNADFELYRLWILLLRSGHTSIWKQKQFISIRFGLHAVVAILLALLYDPNIGLDDTDSCIIPYDINKDPKNCYCGHTVEEIRKESYTTQNIKFQFFSLLFLMFAAIMPTVLAFPGEIKLFINEHRNGWYSTTSYYIAKTITEIPLQLLFSILYVYFLYWDTQQVGLGGYRQCYFLLVTIICCFIAQGLGFLIGIICVRSFNISIILSSSILLFLFLFSGFFVKRATMSVGVGWITSLSFIRYGFESILIILYGWDRCSDKNYYSSTISIFHLDERDFRKNLMMLGLHLLVIRLIAYLLLLYKANPYIFNFQGVKGFKNWSVKLVILFVLILTIVGMIVIAVSDFFGKSSRGFISGSRFFESTV